MADEIGRGVVRVEGDTSSFDAAMAKSAKTAEQAQQKIAGAAGKIGESMAGAAKESERAVEQLNAAQKRHLSRLERTAVEMERGRAGYLEFKAAQLGITNEAAPFITRMRQSEAAVGKLGLSAKQTTAAMRLLPAQITDIVTGLASGQPAYLVAIQQGGQLKDSFGGIVPAARALLSVFTPLKIAIGGGLAVIGGLIAAYNAGSREADAFNRALIMTGNAAGVSTGQLVTMSRNIDAIAGTQARAAEVLAALASTGRVSGAVLERVGATVVKMTREMGISTEEAVKQFAELGKDPVKASEKLNDSYRYLTLEIYNQIAALVEQGRETEAAALAQKTFAESMDDRTARLVQNLGYIERGWLAVKDAIKEAADAMLDIGRFDPEADLRRARADLADLENQRDNGWGFTFGIGGAIDKQREVVRLAQEAVDAAKRKADEEKRAGDLQKAGIDAQKENNKLYEKAIPKAQQLANALKELDDRNARIIAAGGKIDADMDRRAREYLRSQYREKGRRSGDDAATRMLANLRETGAALQAQMDSEEKLGAAAKARIEFEQQIADLKVKKTLTADQKSLLAAEAVIMAELRKNEALEKAIKLRDEELKKAEELRKAEERFAERAAQIQQEIASAREGRLEQYDRQIGAFGRGDMQREMVQAQQSLYREFQRRQAQLLRDTPEHLLGSDSYISESMKIKQALDQAIADHVTYYNRLLEEQAKWENGMSRGLYNYADEAANVAEQSEKVFSGAFRGMEDALTDFVTTGKLSFQDLATFIVAEVNRMIIRTQITGPWAKALNENGGGFAGTLMQAIFGGGAAPSAGDVGMAAWYGANGGVVGSRGIEPFGSGGLVKEPTLFGYAGSRTGMMGEAGYEAIMPVSRGSDGKLGVKVNGGATAPPAVVHMHFPGVRDYEGFRRSENQIKSRVSTWSAGARRTM